MQITIFCKASSPVLSHLIPSTILVLRQTYLVIRIWETVNGPTTESDGAKSHDQGPLTLKPGLTWMSCQRSRTSPPGSSNALDLAHQGRLVSEPFCVFHILRRVVLSSCLSAFFSILQFKIKGDTIHLAQDICFDSSTKKYFYIHKRFSTFLRFHFLAHCL